MLHIGRRHVNNSECAMFNKHVLEKLTQVQFICFHMVVVVIVAVVVVGIGSVTGVVANHEFPSSHHVDNGSPNGEINNDHCVVDEHCF